MNTKDYWDSEWSKFEETDWEDTPTIFAQFALTYFPKEGKILELGAGLGKDTRYFAKYGYYVVSTDFSDKALEIGKWEAAMQKLTNCEFLNVDISQPLPFKEAEFDVVYAHAVLHYFSHQVTDQILTEIARILADGGVFATLLKSKEDPQISKSLKLHENFYRTPEGLEERFFSLEEVHKEVNGLFKPVVLDASEQTHEADNATFIRFIGQKIPGGVQAPHT
jgi:ubiquinone/menaquinone biosynthesis C-methylase UbiE